MTRRTKVIVVGGGYAGVLAANHLRLDEHLEITVINPRPCFVERIRLHQLVTGSDDAVVDYDEVLGRDIMLVVDSVTRIDASARRSSSPPAATSTTTTSSMPWAALSRRRRCPARQSTRIPSPSTSTSTPYGCGPP